MNINEIKIEKEKQQNKNIQVESGNNAMMKFPNLHDNQLNQRDFNARQGRGLAWCKKLLPTALHGLGVTR